MPSARRRSQKALRSDADFLDSRPPWRRLDRLHQLGHLLRERVPGQQRPGIHHQKQKPVILHAAAWDRRASEQAQGLDRESLSAKGGDAAPAAARPTWVGFLSASNARPGGTASPVSAANNTSPHINDDVPMSKMTGLSADGRPKAIGLVSRAGRVAPGGTMCGEPLRDSTP
jgi:hypothetical protein